MSPNGTNVMGTIGMLTSCVHKAYCYAMLASIGIIYGEGKSS